MDKANEDGILDLIARLQGLIAGEPKRNRAKQRQAILDTEFKADAVATSTAQKDAAIRALPTTGSVRVTLCSLDKRGEAADKKLVVLQRAQDISELLKVAKAKLRLNDKNCQAAKLLEGGTAVWSTAELHDGCIVAVCAEVQVEAPTAPSPAAAPQAATTASNSAPVPSDSDAIDVSGVQAPDTTEKRRPEKQRRSILPRRASATATSAESASPRVLRPLSEPSAAMLAAREALPISAHRAALLEAVAEHPVTLVQGEPGCGKSTQLPQFLLERLVCEGNASEAAIVCTQPRRVSAISLALRVADERGEVIGETVGYAVRGEVRSGPNVRILYVTTGWLFKQLAGCLSPPSDTEAHRSAGWGRLHAMRNVIVDEVHERSMQSDLLLTLLLRCAAGDLTPDPTPCRGRRRRYRTV